jgi:hypothetical protein
MLENAPRSLPEPHRAFLSRAMPLLAFDARIIAVAAGGSYLSDTMDEFSDLDLVIVLEPAEQVAVMADRQRIAGSLGSLLASFTGEHVGEPRLLICLYEAPLLHVDLKFVALPDMVKRVEDPAVLWEREGRLTAILQHGHAELPAPNLPWIEERFWVWVHYAAGKIGRGELFEAIDFLSFLRASVLGPLSLLSSGARPTGVRRIEAVAPALAEELRATISGHDARDCVRALRASIDVYRQLRDGPDAAGVRLQSGVEVAAMDYVAEIERQCGP